MATYHYIDGEGKSEGPLESEELRALFADGLVKKTTKVSKNSQGWRVFASYPELNRTAIPSVTADAVAQGSKVSGEEKSENPPGFIAYVILSLLVWPLGLVCAIYWLCIPKHRSAGLAMLGISLASALLAWAVLITVARRGL
jgi:hypothetical protein